MHAQNSKVKRQRQLHPINVLPSLSMKHNCQL